MDLAKRSELRTKLQFLADSPTASLLLDAVLAKASGTTNGDSGVAVAFGDRVLRHRPSPGQVAADVPFKVILEKGTVEFEDIKVGFAEGDRFFDDPEEFAEEYPNFCDEVGDLDLSTLCVVMTENSDVWVAHPTKKSKVGHPLIVCLSHDDTAESDTYEDSLGSLFLRRVAESLEIDPDAFLRAPAESESLQEYWNCLSEDWQGLLQQAAKIKGAVDEKKLGKLLKLKELEIYLDGESVENLKPVAKLSGLKVLKLVRQAKVEDLSPLAGLDLLERFTTGPTQINDLSPLAGLANLKAVQIDDCPLADISPLMGLPKLEHISLTKTRVSDISGVSGLKKLNDLDISSCPIKSLADVASAKKLMHLSLEDTDIGLVDVLEFYRARSKDFNKPNPMYFRSDYHDAGKLVEVLREPLPALLDYKEELARLVCNTLTKCSLPREMDNALLAAKLYLSADCAVMLDGQSEKWSAWLAKDVVPDASRAELTALVGKRAG